MFYSSFSLVPAIWEASDYGSKNYFFSNLTFYIGPYTPRAFRKGEKKFQRFFLEKSINKKRKINEKLVTDFFELIGFIYIKTTVSISWLTSFLRFGKRCFLARSISNSLSFFILHFCDYLWLRSIVFQIVKNSLIVRSRRSFCIP